MKENTYVENMRDPALPQVPLPSALYFREGGSLAALPLSCHPQGCLASEKMRENEDRNGSLFDKPPKNYTERFLRSFTKCRFGDYIPPKLYKLPTKVATLTKFAGVCCFFSARFSFYLSLLLL